jgi:RNA polymerase sigma-70 factor (ECF subfamily)
VTKVGERPRAGPTLPPDDDLVERAQRGDRWAEEALYRRHVGTVSRTVTRLLARSEAAEDIVQDTFVLAFEQVHQLRDPGAFGGWVLQIAVRQAHRWFRRRRLLQALSLDRAEDDATLARLVDPSASPETILELSKLDDLLATLRAKERIAWMLRHVEGHRMDDVARLCDCSLATAKRLVQRAEQRIAEHVELAPWEESV